MKRAFALLPIFLLFVGMLSAQTTVGMDDSTPRSLSEDGVIFIPNAFTPNDDGVNDVYYIPNVKLKQFEFAVFDRWGNKVYQTFNPDFRWEGKSSGQTLSSGTYLYLLTGIGVNGERIKRSGNISLVR